MIAACPWCEKSHAQWGLLTFMRPGEALLCLYCGRWCLFTEQGYPNGPHRPRRATEAERAGYRKLPAGKKLREVFLSTGRKPTRRKV